MKRGVVGFRASPELRALIEQHGDLSAASTALMLIGAQAMGIDLSSVQADLMRLLWARRLSPATQEWIRNMLNTPLTERLTFSGSQAPELLEVDPFANIGIEV